MCFQYIFFPASIRMGGFDNLYLKFMTAIPNTTVYAGNTTCGIPGEDSWHIFRDATSSDLPWPGVLFGIFLLSAWYFCTNQVNFSLCLCLWDWFRPTRTTDNNNLAFHLLMHTSRLLLKSWLHKKYPQNNLSVVHPMNFLHRFWYSDL